MRKFINSAFLGLAVYILAACKPLPSAVFQDHSCSPPCWKQITPGHTPLQDVDSKLRSISAVDSKSIKTTSILQPNDGISFKFLPNMREADGEIFSQGGTVEAIDFSPKGNTLTLSDALQEWGPPERYISIYYSEAEIPNLVTIIIYDDLGIILGSGTSISSGEKPRFENNFPIYYFFYTNPPITNTFLENGLISYNIHNQDLLEGFQTWNGLGEIHYLPR